MTFCTTASVRNRASALAGVASLAIMVALTPVPALAATAPDASAADAADAGESASDRIVVTGTRVPTPIMEVPGTVSVITDEDIADQLMSDVKDLVRFEPGVSVRRAPTRFGAALGVTGRDGNAGFNIRGLEGNRVLIQVDGVRVPDGFEFGAQSAGRGDYVDLGLIKSVEILRGPASALYGSDGLTGAVSFVTSDPVDFLKDDRAYGGMVRGSYDSADDKFTETAIVAGAAGQFSVMGSYTRRDGHEYDNMGTNASANSTRTRPNPQTNRSNAVLGKIVWAPDDENRVRLTFDHLDSSAYTNVLTGVAVTPTPPAVLAATAVIGLTAQDNISRDRVSLDWRYQGSGFIDFAQVTGWYQWAKNRQFTFEDRNTAADRERLNTFNNEVWGVSAELRSKFSTGGIGHTLAYGGDFSQTRQEGIRGGTVPTPPDVFPTRAFPPTDYVLAGAYLADTIDIADGRVKLFPALRFDYYKLTPKPDALTPALPSAAQDGSRVSPKIGVFVKLTDSVGVFANYAQGFKAPSPTQVNQFFSNPAVGYTSIPNANLRPETSETFEGGIRVGSGPVKASVTAFTGDYSGFISQEVVSGSFTPADPAVYQFVNLNRVKIQGGEASIAVGQRSGFSGRFAVSYSEGTVTSPASVRTPLLSIDPMKMVLGAGYDDPARRFGGQLIATYSGQKELTAVTATTLYRPDDFVILDATAYIRIGEIATVRAGIFNLLDKKYSWWSDVRGLADTSAIKDAYTQAGRNASVSISVKF